MSLKVTGRWPAWEAEVERGRLAPVDGSRPPIEVLIRPLGEPGFPLAEAQAEGRRLLAFRHPQALPVLRVMAVGGRACTLHPFRLQVSMERLRRVLPPASRTLPLRVALELAVVVADTLGTALTEPSAGDGRALLHPGPTPSDLLLDEEGQVQVSGFRAPLRGGSVPAPAGYLDPAGPSAPGAGSYAVGALLIDLLTGEPPAPASLSEDRHAAMVRRSLIRLLSRPGPRVPEKLAERIEACLGPRAEQRPGLPRLSVQLSSLAAELPGPGHEAWAREVLGAHRAALRQEGVVRESPPVRTAPPLRTPSGPDTSSGPTVDSGRRGRAMGPDAPTEQTGEAVTEEGPRPSLAPHAPPPSPPTSPLPSPAPSPSHSPPPPAPPREPPTAEVVGAIAIRASGDPAGDPEDDEPMPRRSRAPALFGGLLAMGALVALGLWATRGPPGTPAASDDPGVAASPTAAPSHEREPEPAASAPPVEAAAGTDGRVEDETIPTASGPAGATPAAAPDPAASDPPAPASPSLGAGSSPGPGRAGSAGSAAGASSAGRAAAGSSSSSRTSPPPPTPAEPSWSPSRVEDDSTPRRVIIQTSEPVAMAPTPPDPPPYTLRFTGSAEYVRSMEVSCHGGRSGAGSPVVIRDAIAGPCRITGIGPDGGRLVAHVSVRSSADFLCFVGGERACR